MSSHTFEDLSSCILDFQANMIRVTFRKKSTAVEPELEPSQAAMLDYVWAKSRLGDHPDGDPDYKWRKLGFETEDMTREFREVGLLGLDCLVSRN